MVNNGVSIFSAVLMSLSVITTVSAAEQSPSDGNSWRIYKADNVVNRSNHRARDEYFPAINLITTDPSKPQIQLNCSTEYGLRVSFGLHSREEREKAKQAEHRPRVRQEKLWFRVDGGDDFLAPIYWIRTKRTVQTYKRSTGAKLFNAMVQGRHLTVKDTLFVPPPVDDAFRQFVRECPVTARAQE